MVDVSTYMHEPALLKAVQPEDALRRFLFDVGDTRFLLGPEQLATRLTVLDRLDAIMGNLEMAAGEGCPDPRLNSRANAISFELEAANDELFAAARAELILQGKSGAIHRWLIGPAKRPRPQPGLGFDLLDEIVSGVLKLSEPGAVSPLHSPEMVPYQPTPARHVLDLVAAAKLSSEDVLVDLGSGLGHVPLLVSILTESRAVGIELEPAYVVCSQESARTLKLSRAAFTAGDARGADLSTGTVFYLFSPFKGSTLSDMLQRLRRESTKRQIRICSLGPCTCVLQEQRWLKSQSRPNCEQIAVFESQ
jgi:hypothetical protein